MGYRNNRCDVLHLDTCRNHRFVILCQKSAFKIRCQSENSGAFHDSRNTHILFDAGLQINEQYAIYFLGLGLIDYYWIGSIQRMRLFHGVWISALAFLFAHNSIFIFLAPISKYYTNLYQTLVPNQFSLVAELITAISFSLFLRVVSSISSPSNSGQSCRNL